MSESIAFHWHKWQAIRTEYPRLLFLVLHSVPPSDRASSIAKSHFPGPLHPSPSRHHHVTHLHPSAAELQLALTTATREAEEIIPADRELQALLTQIRAARPRATELAQEVIDELRHATRKIEPGTARDIMRSYGVTFETLEGETPEPGDVPADPATPPTT